MAKGLATIGQGRIEAPIIPLDKIREEPGFNLRDYDSPEVQAQIEVFANAYLTGKQVPPIVAKFIDHPEGAYAQVIEGHLRRRGALLAVERGADLKGLACLPAPRGDKNVLTALIFTTQNGLKLAPLKKAEGVIRMLNGGWSLAEIAANIGVSVQTLEIWLEVAESPREIRDMIQNNTVSPTEAYHLIREEGADAAAVTLQKAADIAKEGGRSRVTAKTIRKAQGEGNTKDKGKARKQSAEPPGVVVGGTTDIDFERHGAVGDSEQDMLEAITAFLAVWEDASGTGDAELNTAINGLRVSIGRKAVVPKVTSVKKAA